MKGAQASREGYPVHVAVPPGEDIQPRRLQAARRRCWELIFENIHRIAALTGCPPQGDVNVPVQVGIRTPVGMLAIGAVCEDMHSTDELRRLLDGILDQALTETL